MAVPIKPTPTRYCAECGKPMTRKRFADGKMESVVTFMKRKYCCIECLCRANNKKPHRRDYSEQIRPDPEKHCEYCGRLMHRQRMNGSGRLEDMAAFMRRKYCSRVCMRKAFVRTDGQQLYGDAHASARAITYLLEGREKVCEICGSTKSIDVHHRDGNHNNNAAENLMVVCRSCHMKIHRNNNK